MFVRAKLVRQVIRSLREYPEDWTFGERWATNDHLKIRIYKRYHAPFLDVWYKEEQVIKDWRNILAYFVPWRCRLLQVVRSAERDHKMKKLSLKIEDSFETATLGMMETNLRYVAAMMYRFQNRAGG